jgi:hypothetical protein
MIQTPESRIPTREKEAHAVAHISRLLMTHFHFAGVDEVVEEGPRDPYAFRHLVFAPDERFTQITDFPSIRVLIVREGEMTGFGEKGRKFKNMTPSEWQKGRLFALSGDWSADDSIIADFMAQTANLMKILDTPGDMQKFVETFDAYPQQCFRGVQARGILERDRRGFYDWAAGRASSVMVYQHAKAPVALYGRRA